MNSEEIEVRKKNNKQKLNGIKFDSAKNEIVSEMVEYKLSHRI